MDDRRPGPDRISEPVEWPPLVYGHNEPGPTDEAGEYLASEQAAPGEQNVGLAGMPAGARVPGEVRPYEQPVDVASPSAGMPDRPEDASQAERSARDPRHVARGKPSMSSSEGSS